MCCNEGPACWSGCQLSGFWLEESVVLRKATQLQVSSRPLGVSSGFAQRIV